jgi:hypothetical protein
VPESVDVLSFEPHPTPQATIAGRNAIKAKVVLRPLRTGAGVFRIC